MTEETVGDAQVGHEPANDAELLELFRRRGADPSVRDELVTRFLPFAGYLARRFLGRGEPLEDLVQVANVGLVNAIDRFDADRDVRFTTYAAATIVGELKRHLRDRAWSVRVPRSLQDLGLRVNRTLPELTQELGRSPTVDELAHRLGAEPDEVVEAMDATRAYSAISLDAPIEAGGTTASDLLGDDDASMEVVEEWVTIAPAVAELPARERRVLYLRFFRGMTQSEIARDIGVSQMHVSRILAATLEQLRNAAEPQAGPENDEPADP
jgi:RNA polymerase sigma-B factor